jgi:hypothetical protein
VNDDVLTFEARPCGRGKMTVTVRHRENVVYADDITPTSAKHREAFAKALRARVPVVGESLVETELLRIAAAPDPAPAADATPAGQTDDLLAAMPADVREEAATLLADAELIRRVVEDVEAQGVAGERELTATIYLVGVSRLLTRPLAAIVQGPSSSGKSYLIRKVSDLFPPEGVIHATQMTPQALYHMKSGSLRHRWIVAGERSRVEDDERAEATRALREMLSDGRLSKMVPVKVGGAIETVLIEQEGPIAFVESTTLAKVFEEDANRCLMLHTDERAEQTQRVIAMTASGLIDGKGDRRDRRAQVHQAAQRMLKAYVVCVPFADRLGELFPCERVEARRAFSHLLGMVQASALLHQSQRNVDADGRLVAEAADYQIARYLLNAPLAKLLSDRISDPARRCYDALADEWPNDPDPTADRRTFTTTEARKAVHGSKSATRGWLGELLESCAIELVEEGQGRRPSVWRLTDVPPSERATSRLPTVDEVFGEGACVQDHKMQLKIG